MHCPKGRPPQVLAGIWRLDTNSSMACTSFRWTNSSLFHGLKTRRCKEVVWLCDKRQILTHQLRAHEEASSYWLCSISCLYCQIPRFVLLDRENPDQFFLVPGERLINTNTFGSLRSRSHSTDSDHWLRFYSEWRQVQISHSSSKLYYDPWRSLDLYRYVYWATDNDTARATQRLCPAVSHSHTAPADWCVTLHAIKILLTFF